MLKTRLLTALVLAPLVVAGIYLAPPLLYAAIFATVIAAAAYEWAALVGLRSAPQRWGYTLAFAMLALAIYVFASIRTPLLWGAAAFWLLATFRVLRFADSAPLVGVAGLDAVLGLLVLGGSFTALLELRDQAQGAHWVLLSLALVWLADVGAYFAGRRFGRRKLLPSVSPGKTWEGVAGALVITVAVMVTILVLWQAPLLPWLLALPVLVALSVLGDLFESTLKRRADVKDSGNLLPGHGGMLDRVDAQLAVLPVMALLVSQLAHTGA